jgi:hypothetical protein
MHRVRVRLEKVRMALDTSLFDRPDDEVVVLKASARRDSGPSSYSSSPPPTPPTSTHPTVSNSLTMPSTCVDTYAACPFCDRAVAETEASTLEHSSSLFDDDDETPTDDGDPSTGAAQVHNMLPDYVYMVL